MQFKEAIKFFRGIYCLYIISIINTIVTTILYLKYKAIKSRLHLERDRDHKNFYYI